eukprot:TRINITY_DN14133_c0_g1_i1.p1 TRINITY_DN14133_c0_g1~~TRINITY_DN14133_c0_g1_i1.p1  ORF type:complete len:71 (+),score=11.30 TRINITY_DN14133_c0_g1_i1:113-325(+)
MLFLNAKEKWSNLKNLYDYLKECVSLAEEQTLFLRPSIRFCVSNLQKKRKNARVFEGYIPIIFLHELFML